MSQTGLRIPQEDSCVGTASGLQGRRVVSGPRVVWRGRLGRCSPRNPGSVHVGDGTLEPRRLNKSRGKPKRYDQERCKNYDKRHCGPPLRTGPCGPPNNCRPCQSHGGVGLWTICAAGHCSRLLLSALLWCGWCALFFELLGGADVLYPDAFAAELRKTTCRLVPGTCFDWPDGADEIYLNAFAGRPLSAVSGAYDVAYNFEQSVDTHFRGCACVAARAGHALAVDRRRRSPCAGQRIGEASNPGPGASAAKRRKQEGPITRGQVRNICKQLLREFVNELGWHGSFPQARPTAEPQHDEFQDWQAGDSDCSEWPGHSHRDGSGWWDATSSGRGEWQDRWHGAFSSWDAEAIAGAKAKAGHAVSYDGAFTATPGASWSTSWDDWGGSAPRRRWADLHDEEEGDANDDSGKDPAPARSVSLRLVHDRTAGAPAAGAKSRWRKRKSRKADGDVDELHAEPWTLRRDLWNTSGPFAYVNSVVELSELLDTAQGVSILAQASSEDDAAEMWDIIKSAAQDPDAFDTALTLLCPVSDQSKPWCPDDDTATSLVPVPGTQAGKLVHVKHWACSIGSAPPSLGTRREAIHKVRRPPAPLQVQRAQSILS